ncbi:metalloproteinase inhibitor 1-like isoform X2 [Ambystoma mexicanum]|uniref:metalloproteinase inhibitor 1-like isoform X2 n=1 Tax=Ambystoma mexicanum TaxID=8296 RepID=UPI0037E802E1
MKSMMWMSLAVASLFLLTCSSVESCICMGMHLQRDVCTSDIVIKGKFLRFAKASQTANTGRSMPIFTFDVEVQEVFKGGEQIRGMNFTTTSTRCTFEMNPSNLNLEHVIAGNIGPGSVELNSCNYIKPWSELSSEQVVGLRGAYAEGCRCENPATTEQLHHICTNSTLHVSQHGHCPASHGLMCFNLKPVR